MAAGGTTWWRRWRRACSAVSNIRCLIVIIIITFFIPVSVIRLFILERAVLDRRRCRRVSTGAILYLVISVHLSLSTAFVGLLSRRHFLDLFFPVRRVIGVRRLDHGDAVVLLVLLHEHFKLFARSTCHRRCIARRTGTQRLAVLLNTAAVVLSRELTLCRCQTAGDVRRDGGSWWPRRRLGHRRRAGFLWGVVCVQLRAAAHALGACGCSACNQTRTRRLLRHDRLDGAAMCAVGHGRAACGHLAGGGCCRCSAGDGFWRWCWYQTLLFVHGLAVGFHSRHDALHEGLVHVCVIDIDTNNTRVALYKIKDCFATDVGDGVRAEVDVGNAGVRQENLAHGSNSVVVEAVVTDV
eukprot:PhM_4_TR398/c1_g4_i4/m.91137